MPKDAIVDAMDAVDAYSKDAVLCCPGCENIRLHEYIYMHVVRISMHTYI